MLLAGPLPADAQQTVTVIKQGTGSGTVVSDPAGINCGTTCTNTFPIGFGVVLTATPGAGSVFAGWQGCFTSGGNVCNLFVDSATVRATFNAASTTGSANYSDIWWNPSESGWGITIADHQTQMFAVWYTYRHDGSPTWFVIPGGTFSQGRRIFAGDVYQTTGPPFGPTFDPSRVSATRAGLISIDFAPSGLAAGTALFTYNIGSITGTKQIQRQSFGNGAPDWGNDLTDIYWDAAESGWGLTVAQHGTSVFVVWYTYDAQGRPLFVVMPNATFSGSLSFTGDLYTTTGPYFGNAFFDSSQVRATNAGNATIEFTLDAASTLSKASRLPCHSYFLGCRGKMRGRLNGVAFDKWISQQTFGYAAPDTPPPAACMPEYTEWSACNNGLQGRSVRVFTPLGCQFTGQLQLTQACTGNPPPPQACTYQYTSFGSCINGLRSRTVSSSSPPGCVGTPVLTEACTAPPCNYLYGPPYGACVNGIRTRTVLSVTPEGCVGTPILSEACTGSLPPGFPTNVTLGTYRLDVEICAYGLPTCINQSQTLVNADITTFANQLVSVLNGALPVTPGCSTQTSYTAFNGVSFSVTLTIRCTSPGQPDAVSTVRITATKI